MIEEHDLDVLIAPDGAHHAREAVAPYLPATRDQPTRSADPWLPMIVGRIVRLVDPVKIVLFGSRAREDGREDSDYDLLVIVEEVANRRAMSIAIRRSFEDLPVAADVVVATTAGGRRPHSRSSSWRGLLGAPGGTGRL